MSLCLCLIQSTLHNTDITIACCYQATCLKKTKSKIKRRNTEPSIFFPNDPNLSTASPQADGESMP